MSEALWSLERNCSGTVVGLQLLVCLFVNRSTLLVKTVFKSLFCFSNVLFVAAVAVSHVNNVFRVAVYMIGNMSSFEGRMKCVTGTSVCYVVTTELSSHRKDPWVVLCRIT